MANGFSYRELTDAEREEFLKDNFDGILTFAGDKPYAIPMAYFYRKGDLLLGLTEPGRKIDCSQKSPRVCYTILRRRWQPDLKQPCTTIVVEGELEEVADRSYYNLPPLPEGVDATLFRIKVDKLSTRVCTELCGLLTKPWVDVEAYAHWVHEEVGVS